MALERTLALIKPDAVENGKAGLIVAQLEKEGFRVRALRQLRLSRLQAEGFYEVHRERPFFGELVSFMSRGPIVAMVLEREDAIAKYREVIGATDPKKAAPGTVRALYGTDVGENAVHGSDAPATAAVEIAYFFAGYELRLTG
ncbi:MAG: nucleoside-diphosphate kinase [Myxococcales bacterium]|nr:nucleoside-diphosphate kinase [Myxococcales bacterium]MCC6521281.1 nucleoside-diphosphate kinase [Polyangiaceae bacterium]